MKNIKDITISIFAIIGFVAIVSGFTNNETEQEHSVPESHVWELQIAHSNAGASGGRAYLVNKVTGEVITYDIVNTREERRAIKDPNERTYLYGYSSFEKK